jgi:hypothetical protein
MQLSPSSQLLSTAQVNSLLNLRAGKRTVRYRLADVKRFIADGTTA